MALYSNSPAWSGAPRSSFRSRDDWSLKWWIMFALILSFLLHGLLFVSFDKLGKYIAPSAPAIKLTRVPERIKIDPKLLQEQKAIAEIPEIIAPGNQPEIKTFEPNLDSFDKQQMIAENQEIDLTPNVKEVTNFLRATEMGDGKTPGAKQPDMAALLAVPLAMEAPDMASAMEAVRKEVLSKPVSEKQMLLDSGALDPTAGAQVDVNLLDQVKAQGQGDGTGERVKGFSNLDDLLGGGGTMGGSTAPILMPTDLLFAYGSDQLAEGARLSLMKLGFLIQKNPDSLFIIEGHTDSYGGDEFNLQLSLRRAHAVVSWLQQSLHLGMDRIQAAGLGKRKPLVDPNGTVEAQSLNRRVEIKVRPKR